jgi:hypothetical protein
VDFEKYPLIAQDKDESLEIAGNCRFYLKIPDWAAMAAQSIW